MSIIIIKKQQLKNTLLIALFSILFNIGFIQAEPSWKYTLKDHSVTKWVYLESISSEGTSYFAAILKANKRNARNQIAVFQLNQSGDISKSWSYSLPAKTRGNIEDFAVTDLDFDGKPEIAAIFNIELEKSPDWLRVFEWTGANFPPSPTTVTNIILDRGTRNRPGQIIWNTFVSGKGKQISVLFRGSQRKAYTFNRSGQLSASRWQADSEIISQKFLNGTSVLHFTSAGFRSGENNDFVFYANENGQITFSVVTLDGTGKSVEKGYVNAAAAKLPGNLLTMTTNNSAGANDEIFFTTDKGGLGRVHYSTSTGMSISKIDNPLRANITLLSVTPSIDNTIVYIGKDNSSTISSLERQGEEFIKGQNYKTVQSGSWQYAVLVKRNNQDFLMSVNNYRNALAFDMNEILLPEEIVEDSPADNNDLLAELKGLLNSPAPEQELITKDALEEIPIEDSQLPAIDMGPVTDIPKPKLVENLTYKIMEYDYVFTTSDVFTQNIPLGQIDPGTMNISWDAPEGAVFNIQTGEIGWDIADEQLNQNIFDLKISSRNDTAKYYWNIYVNDIPKILNEQKNFIISMDEPFEFTIDVEDLNEDPEIIYTLEGLPGGNISKDGIVSWNPGNKHLNITTFSVSVSDGFIVVKENFMIYVNDPIKIVSRPQSHILPEKELWTYDLSIEDANETYLYQLSFTSAERLESMQTKIAQFLSKDKVSVELERFERKFIDVRANVKNIQTFQNKLFLTLHSYNKQTNFTEILSGIFSMNYKDIPKYSAKQIKQQHFRLLSSPEGVELDKRGHIQWTPSEAQLDSQLIEIEATDVISQDRQTLNLYVNSAPVITSKPKALVLNNGEILEYQCTIEDKNRNPKITYSLNPDSPPAELDEYGHLLWRVKPGQYDYDQLTIIVSDGYEEDEITLMMYVNDPVKAVPFEISPAMVGQVWKQQLKYSDRNKTTLYRIKVQDIAKFDRIKEQIALFLGRQKVPVLRSKSSGQTVEIDVRPAVKNLFAFSDNLFIEKDPDYTGDARLTDIFSGILETPIDYLPKNKMFHDKKVKFKAIRGPKGMTVSEGGEILWVPNPSQIDTFRVSVLVTDAMTSDTLYFKIFSNSPPAIVSTPENLVHLGDVWKYQVQIADLNKNQPYFIELVDAPEGFLLENSTFTWKPTMKYKGNNTISFIVSDGHQNAAQTFNLFVNVAPEITSKPVIVALTGFDYSYQIIAEDVNGDEVRYTAVDIPRWADLDEKTGELSWQPRSSERGINTFKINCTDSHNRTTLHQFDVQVYEDPSAKKFSLAVFPLMVTFVGVIIMAALL